MVSLAAANSGPFETHQLKIAVKYRTSGNILLHEWLTLDIFRLSPISSGD